MDILQHFKRLMPVFGLAVFLSGCSSQDSDVLDTTSVNTRTIHHVMGATDVPENPRRIVVLSVEATETLLALGIKPVGAVRSETANPSDTWFAHIRDDMEGTPVVGQETQINLEAVASLQPDLIIGIKARQEALYPQLSAIAPTVFTDQFQGRLRENLSQVSAAVGREQEGQDILTDLDHRIERLSSRLDDAGFLEQEVGVYRFQVTGARYYYNTSFAAGLIKELGFARPELHDKDDFAEPLTMERIPEADADIQFYFTFAAADPESGVENTNNWLSHPLWQELRAHQKGQIYQMDNDIWNKSYGILSGRKVLQNIEDALLPGQEKQEG
ncbi:ABC transporter substrate-binding protein [Endozoicomonas montiporae]|uniref:Iron ABC transporter substrate-binding protein n=1 Tax=Endozoicomonas montiporae CL-33 TaxID=570277 RepID=A0A142B701_9GAMM|nr:iron-siderophore ABC transporter substrate-binding protein [Endozoicomonas montiporae]AMO54527.1 iron ABC transporter substrate-binding protein [Endozoicomonas montiporae CL-33]